MHLGNDTFTSGSAAASGTFEKRGRQLPVNRGRNELGFGIGDFDSGLIFDDGGAREGHGLGVGIGPVGRKVVRIASRPGGGRGLQIGGRYVDNLPQVSHVRTKERNAKKQK